jgi:glycopeptide antibiotics resistance protein
MDQPSHSDPPEKVDGSTAKKADLAVVLVHGIGSQEVGATLLSWAEPIVKELQSHLPNQSASVSYGATQLQADPASTTIHFRTADQPAELTWIFVEARWAASFPWPGASEVLSWTRSFVPRATQRIWHQLSRPVDAYRAALIAVGSESLNFQGKIRLRIARLVFIIYSTVWFLVTALAVAITAGVAVGLAAGLAILGVIPFLRKRIAPLSTQLVASVGDAYLFTSRPLHAAAMVDSITTVLDGAKAAAENVCVIAHSQGAALAVRALVTRRRASLPDMLITVGAGVNLLAQETGPVASWVEHANTMRWVNIWTPWDPVPAGPIADCTKHEAQRAAEATSVAGVLGPMFRNTGASGQPVGVSDVGSAEDRPDGPEEWPVYNRASVFQDHVTYVSNIPQVIRPITHRLIALTCGQPGALPAVDEAHVRRVRYLGAARLVSGVIALAFMASRVVFGASGGSNAGTLAAWIHDRYEGIFTAPVLGAVLTRLLTVIGILAYEGVLTLGVFALAYLTLQFVWTRWDRSASAMSVEESNQTEYPFSLRTNDSVTTFATRPKGRTRARFVFKLMLIMYCYVAYSMLLFVAIAVLPLESGDTGQKFVVAISSGVVSPVIIYQVVIWPRGGVRLRAIHPNGGATGVQPAPAAPLLVDPNERAVQWGKERAARFADRARLPTWFIRTAAILLGASVVVFAVLLSPDAVEFEHPPVDVAFGFWHFQARLVDLVTLPGAYIPWILGLAVFVLSGKVYQGSRAARIGLRMLAAASLACLAGLVLANLRDVSIECFDWHFNLPLGAVLLVVAGAWVALSWFAAKQISTYVQDLRSANKEQHAEARD